jgi:hypothetical protein
VGDELYLYYAGYRWGHKYHHSVDRKIGLVKMQRDRFVARRAGAKPGTLTTRPLLLEGGELSLNVAAKGGEVRVQLTTPQGEAIPGFRFEDCRPITADALAVPVEWSQKLESLRGQPVRIELSLKDASLYALEVE